ncbi:MULTISPECIES: DUF4268 domain-containing protein [Streptococcus]|uniref:DUF4268 domain-containing protein n=1 Tax=Streptococcus caledonicus TaxID=2614158 RepID=A0ABW0UFR0_9STRE|nr:DUF4268 domain-containing protein [Streptococcus sp. S784/96/1]
MFGILEEVDVRKLWQHEQYDFSNWLAQDENINQLGNEIGLTLVDVNKEVFVGSYRCDLVATDETTGMKVILENQLEATNHDHLGKLITYASGLGADVVVWIVKEAREEHRSAIEWLNSKTTQDISFFLIEIHAYQIGNSLPAPKFVIVEKPNDFIKATRAMSGDKELSRSQAERLNFWNQMNECLEEKNYPFNVRKATTDHWYDVAIGTSKAHISITLVNQTNAIGIEYYINNDKDLFDKLQLSAQKLEEELGFVLEWRRLDNQKASRIIHYISGLDFNNQTNYPQLIEEVIDKVVRMKEIIKEYL